MPVKYYVSCLEAQILVMKQSSFKVFFIMQLGYRHQRWS